MDGAGAGPRGGHSSALSSKTPTRVMGQAWGGGGHAFGNTCFYSRLCVDPMTRRNKWSRMLLRTPGGGGWLPTPPLGWLGAHAYSSSLHWSHQPSSGTQGPQPRPLSLGCWVAGAELCGPPKWGLSQRLAPSPAPPTSLTPCLSGSSCPVPPTRPWWAAGPPGARVDCRSCFRKQRGLPPNCRGGNRKAATGLPFANKKAGVRPSSQVFISKKAKKKKKKKIPSFCLSATFAE